MGGSGNGPSKAIDASVGGLVWVRRRNGSWWPGRILGPNELPENSSSMPRLGTPVKLLGREDASVDWYNLDRSKRVKAFRCGDYDDCIEKAKAAGSYPFKKATKYARREDAIIHALKLESVRLGKDHPDFSDGAETYDGEHPCLDELPSSFHTTQEDNADDGHLSSCDVSDLSCSSDESNNDSELSQEGPQSGLSFEKSDLVDATKEATRRWRTPNDSEDDGTGGVKRMKGLEDIGTVEASSLKRKKSLVDHVHEFLKRKNRRRTLTKVLESTPRLPLRVCAPSSPIKSSVPVASNKLVSVLESNGPNKHNSIVIDNDSLAVSCENQTSLSAPKQVGDTSFRCKLKENEIYNSSPENVSRERLSKLTLVAEGLFKIGSGESEKPRIGTAAESCHGNLVDIPSLGNEEPNEIGVTSPGSRYVLDISQSIEKGASEWQLKGKRNSRLRKADADNEADAIIDGDSFLVGSNRKADFNRVGGALVSESYIYNSKDRPPAETRAESSHRWSWNIRRDSHARGSTADLSTADLLVPQRSLPYRQSRFILNPKYKTSDRCHKPHISSASLYDVPMEVKTSHQPQCVPYVSLMSRMNRRPIVGHPLAIEKLSDGLYDDLIRTAKSYSSRYRLDTSDCRDVNVANRQKPRGRALSKHRTSQAYSSPTISPKSRQNVLLSKKMRRLSSLTGSRRSKEKRQQAVEKLKGPSLACIPLNVVFSRIMAAMNNSIRPAPPLVAKEGM